MKKLSTFFAGIMLTSLLGCGTSAYRVPYNTNLANSNEPIYFNSQLTTPDFQVRLINQITARKEPFEALPQTTKEKSNGESIYLPFEKKNSGQVMANFGLVVGLIDIAIEASETKQLEQKGNMLLEPVRNVASNIDLNEIFLKKLNQNVLSSQQLNNHFILTNEEYKSVSNSPEKRLFSISTQAIFTSDFSALQVYSFVVLSKVKNNKQINKRARGGALDFRNSYQYISPKLNKAPEIKSRIKQAIQETREAYQLKIENTINIPEKRYLKRELIKDLRNLENNYLLDESNEELSKRWSSNNGYLIKLYLEEAATEISRMILLDLEDQQQNNTQNNLNRKYESGLQIITENKERVIVRDIQTARKGQLCSLKKGTPGAYCKYLL
ncbi:hypothetical protein [Aliikangiella sp. G2MR2-5]|uniref:hypothetical protein n=1 Tax=Aliikangiella sp. G2MR2-5 TaxID=2788943 RepID=UPI0018A9F84C|nr:hypothetical protein [Aliikangiella sp. G2MR2-5]